MRKFIVAMINKDDQQKDWPIMAESPAQAAIHSFLKETESLEDKNKEEEETIERFKAIIKVVDEKEKSGELQTEADGVKMVNEVMGMHTANPISGDFSVGVNGFLLEKGEKRTPVKGIAISGNIMTLFNRVISAGTDLRFFGSTGAPSLLIEEIDISGN